MKLKTETLIDQILALERGETTARAIAERAFARQEECIDLNAFVSLSCDLVLAQADASDARRASGACLSPIDGVPIAVKDNYLTLDYPTTACSNARPLEPEGVDALVVSKLRYAGAVIFGKTNMHEWAYGATNSTSSIGPTRNPHNFAHITGGSSGGSAAAVASGIVAAALGSDTGGSIRIPASACGVYGFKPSYGRASRRGVLPLSWSLDAPGPLAASLADIEVLLPYFFGADVEDASTRFSKPFGGRPSLKHVPKLINLVGPGLERDDVVDASILDALRKSGGDVTDRSLDGVRRYFGAWEAILHCEASAYHRPLLEANGAGFSPVTRAHLEAGYQLGAQDLLQAQQIRADFVAHLANGLGDWDALVLPTLPVPVPRMTDDWQSFGGRHVSTQDSMTWFCWLGNLAGLPAVSIPVGFSPNGLPIGMMLMGKAGKDEELLEIARIVDDAMKRKR